MMPLPQLCGTADTFNLYLNIHTSVHIYTHKQQVLRAGEECAAEEAERQ